MPKQAEAKRVGVINLKTYLWLYHLKVKTLIGLKQFAVNKFDAEGIKNS